MALPQRPPVVRWIGFGILVLTLWFAVVLLLVSPGVISMIETETFESFRGGL